MQCVAGQPTMLEGVVEVASLKTGLRLRDRHLLSADFFDCAKHPQMFVFALVFERRHADSIGAIARVTIKGVTRPIPLEAKVTRAGDDLVITASAELDRTEFGVQKNRLDTLMVDRAVRIDLRLVASPEAVA